MASGWMSSPKFFITIIGNVIAIIAINYFFRAWTLVDKPTIIDSVKIAELEW